MDVFGKGTAEPSRPLLPPGNCWICGNSPQQEAIKVIDTRRNTQAGGTLSHASNRIYICQPCAEELGAAMGMVSYETYGSLQFDAADLKASNTRLRAQLDEVLKERHKAVTQTADEIRVMLREEIARKVPAKQTQAKSVA